ncbi:MAG: glutamine--tRNA ligase [Halothiobacillus sp. 20-53-49]|jgi:glutaminyl-tRNA synthetase|nr:glutamine--tRNA ligase/YqeY domain fusion protein [Halothiobacillaceae bacterium]OYV47458.1 MAG: glutamine--tRNA ligase [Halothiobacillus sp. 20-53-49]OYY30814.1 MAG: glutamine--tRNA ligase [Halothiobacillus sp. 35-54-62]OZB47419.1 MAG: glutamine--tRNA ligase [Polynucleobacter sp. 39-45-136]HQS03136.1 glutamine--tRNA ligase/YqeY domain fusion protein [Halothiobacillus sp.]
MTDQAADTTTNNVVVSNFIRSRMDEDCANKTYSDTIATRFPPEPNGFLHFGHAKSIFLNFGLAQDYAAQCPKSHCNLRFDDTNPTKEETEYVDAIREDVAWLGFDTQGQALYASDYFERLYHCAEQLIQTGLAYVDSQDSESLRAKRGTLTEAGTNSPYRDRSIEENLDLFRRMRAGEFPDGAHILRAKIDMASPNMNMRDPAIYRIRHAHHHRTGDAWCIYPMYDFAHCVSDAIEGISHSLCTLEFADHRPLYEWFLGQLAELGEFKRPLPQQIEFSRLNLTYVVLSKRKLIQLVTGGHVDGWDDPRLPTLKGARRRGFTLQGFKLFADRIGISKSDSLIDYQVLEDCMREDLNERAERRVAVLDPIKLILSNFPENHAEPCLAPNHPHHPDLGKREIQLTRELWIEREDFMIEPSKGFFRLTPGKEVRLRYGYIVKCTGFDVNDNGQITCVYAEYDPTTKSGTPGSEARKVKGNIHWLSCAHSVPAEIRLYDRLFNSPNPGGRQAGDAPEQTRDFLDDLNPNAKHIQIGRVEPALAQCQRESCYQFERNGYFVADQFDHSTSKPVFNRTVTLRDTWSKN